MNNLLLQAILLMVIVLLDLNIIIMIVMMAIITLYTINKNYTDTIGESNDS